MNYALRPPLPANRDKLNRDYLESMLGFCRAMLRSELPDPWGTAKLLWEEHAKSVEAQIAALPKGQEQ